MTEDEARDVELVRAVELEDRGGVLLTTEDRAQADARARAMGDGAGRKGETAFIARRAQFAAARLATRHPGIAGVLGRTRWPRWPGIVLPAAALIAGFLANEIGAGHRLDLLAIPLLGTIGWNLAVYLWVAVEAVSGKGGGIAHPLLRAIGRLGGAARRDFDAGSPIARAARDFQARWAAASAPVAGARIGRTLHLGAALFAAGLIGGIYLRALVVEYRAGWESTFLGPEAVHGLIALILGPASAITGVAIPGVAEMAAMRWTGPGAGLAAGGVNAAPWIHLYTATIVGLIIVPRLLLALGQGTRAWRLARHFPVPGREDFYIRRLLRSAGGAPGIARITPYAYRPDAETRRRLTDALRAALGDGAQVRFDTAVDYGAEDGWLAAHPGDPDDDYHLLLFTLSATPEAENHGALAGELARRIADGAPGTVLAAVIDESPYRAHFAGQSGLEDRIAARLEAWRNVLAGAGIVPLGVDLAAMPDDALACRIESGLLPDGGMRG